MVTMSKSLLYLLIFTIVSSLVAYHLVVKSYEGMEERYTLES
jgi:hypothetical protein